MTSKLATTTGQMIINLAAVRNNWQMLNKKSNKAECAAVVKADGYGCGAKIITKTLIKTGCKTFFVATPQEAISLRAVNKKIRIFSFAGLDEKTKNYFVTENIIPVLNSLEEINIYSKFAKQKRRKLKCAIHIDTGMNRLGLNIFEWRELAIDKEKIKPLNIQLLMTHFACADVIGHKKTKQQVKLFKTAAEFLPNIPCSAANSAAILQNKNYCFDLTRPGTAIYGGQALANKNPMHVVASLFGKIIKIRHCEKGQTIGYGATEKAGKKMKIAYVGIGYGDGYPRVVSNKGVGLRKIAKPAQAFFKGHYLNGVGRISMDMCGFDISKVPDGQINVGDYIELIGENILLESVAKSAGTIGYEILTRLSHRCARIYKGK